MQSSGGSSGTFLAHSSGRTPSSITSPPLSLSFLARLVPLAMTCHQASPIALLGSPKYFPVIGCLPCFSLLCLEGFAGLPSHLIFNSLTEDSVYFPHIRHQSTDPTFMMGCPWASQLCCLACRPHFTHFCALQGVPAPSFQGLPFPGPCPASVTAPPYLLPSQVAIRLDYMPQKAFLGDYQPTSSLALLLVLDCLPFSLWAQVIPIAVHQGVPLQNHGGRLLHLLSFRLGWPSPYRSLGPS